MIYSVTKFLVFLIFKIFFSLKITGQENIPAEGPFIIASNHASYLDPFAAGIGFRRKTNFMTKEEAFRNRFFGWYLRKLHCFPLKRHRGDRRALREAFEILRYGKSLVIFPEGTRSQDGNMKEGKIGVSVLSHMAKAPVVPCYIDGSYKIWPINSHFFHKGRLSVYYGKPLRLPAVNEKHRKADYYNFAQEVMLNIKALRDNACHG